MTHRSPLRILAPLAIIAFAVALFIVITTTLANQKSNNHLRSGVTPIKYDAKRSSRSAKKQPHQKAVPKSYTIKPGDSLGVIAEKFGIPIQKLIELNPELDPQTIVAGERIKLTQ